MASTNLGEDSGSLRRLSDEALLRETNSVIAAGRRGTALLLRYLGEVERRRLHLRAASPSMFDFCVRRLGMSEGEAFRRITGARLGRRYPVIYDWVAAGKLHLSALVLVRDFLTPENHAALLGEIAGKSKGEIQMMLAGLRPRPDVPARITTLPRGRIEPLAPARYRVEFTAGSEFKRKLELALDLGSHANPSRDIAALLERGLDLLIAHFERDKLGKVDRPRSVAKSGSGERIAVQTRREVVAARRNSVQLRQCAERALHGEGVLGIRSSMGKGARRWLAPRECSDPVSAAQPARSRGGVRTGRRGETHRSATRGATHGDGPALAPAKVTCCVKLAVKRVLPSCAPPCGEGDTLAFEGIPYAADPSGSRRWTKPDPSNAELHCDFWDSLR
jgi:hypothetical protein